MEEKFNVVILAGARNEGPLRDISSYPYEALIPIGSKPMVEHVIDAVREAKTTGEILVVGPKKELEKHLQGKVKIIQSSSSMVENIKLGVKEFASSRYVLVVTSDIPLITSRAIDDFITSCQKKKADIFYPLISKQANKERYPGVRRTYVRLIEGTFTGGNMVLLKAQIIDECQKMLEKVISWRKKPWKLSQLLGLKFIFKFFLGRLSLQEIEERVSQIIGFKGIGLIVDFPEVGFDVDKPSDLELMQEIFSKRLMEKAN